MTEKRYTYLDKNSYRQCIRIPDNSFDAYFDFLPGGYSDDLAMMTVLLIELAVYTTPEVEERVEDYLPESCTDD